jgi:outer membrane protein TolC
MARIRKTITLDEKIEQAQMAVEKAKARYDATVKELRDLLDKKDAQRKQELLKAVENSPRTFDEIMAFLKAEE